MLNTHNLRVGALVTVFATVHNATSERVQVQIDDKPFWTDADQVASIHSQPFVPGDRVRGFEENGQYCGRLISLFAHDNSQAVVETPNGELRRYAVANLRHENLEDPQA